MNGEIIALSYVNDNLKIQFHKILKRESNKVANMLSNSTLNNRDLPRPFGNGSFANSILPSKIILENFWFVLRFVNNIPHYKKYF